MILNDTRTNTNTNTSSFFPEYTLHKKDPTEATGGIAFLIHNTIPHKLHDTIIGTPSEHIIITLHNNTTVVGIYNHPKNPLTTKDLDNLLDTGTRVVVVGDFNANNIRWNCPYNNKSGRILYNYTNSHNAQLLHSTTPTHYPPNNMSPSTIDLVLFKNISHITRPISLPELPSDHNPIIFKLRNTKSEDRTRQITSYKKTDWTKFRQTLDKNITIDYNIQTEEQLEASILSLSRAITKALQKHTKTKTITLQHRNTQLPQSISDLIAERNRTRRTWQRSRDLRHKTHMNTLTRTIRSVIYKHTNETWTKKLKSLNIQDNSLWNMSKILRKPFSRIPTLDHNTRSCFTDNEKANALADVFEQIHTIDPILSPEQQHIHDTVLTFTQNKNNPTQNTKTSLCHTIRTTRHRQNI